MIARKKTRGHNLAEVVPPEELLTTGDILDFMSEVAPDDMWCTSPELHYHARIVCEEVQHVIADIIYTGDA